MIEAEGSIVMSVNIRADRLQNLRVTPRVIFTNTDDGLIRHYLKILDRAGIGRHVRVTKPNNTAHVEVMAARLVKKSYKDITYIAVEGFKRVRKLLDVILPFMVSEKKERAEALHRFVTQRLLYAEINGAEKGNYAYRESDVGLMLDFLRMTKTAHYERIAGMLNEHTREAKHEHRKGMRRIYIKSAKARGYVRPSRRALISRESVRGARNEHPLLEAC